MIFCLSFAFALTACGDEEPENNGIDVSGVTFVDQSFDYDGEEHSITVKNLPDGVIATYTGNNQTEPGTYIVTAKLADKDGNELAVLSARMIINEASDDLPSQDPTGGDEPSGEPTPDDPTQGNTELPTTGYAVMVGETVYVLSENTSATLLEGQTAEYMALGLNVVAGDKFAVYKDGVEITTNIGPNPGDNNATGTDGAFTVVMTAADAQVYFQTWADGGHSFWLTGNTGTSGGDDIPTDAPAAEYTVKVGDVEYDLTLNTSATLLDGQTAEYMALGLNVVAGDKFAVYKNGVEITANIGPDPGSNNASGADGAFTVVKTAEGVGVYFKTWADGGHSFWLEGNTPTAGEDTASTLYLKPNSNWTKDGARFAAYFFGNGETWVSMTDEDGDGIYECEVPTGYAQVIFCRMNPNAPENNWNNKWNQTSDLTIPSDGTNLYTVKDGTWDKGAGTWSTK